MFFNLILSLANSFLLEMVITKDPSYLSLQYFMYLVTVACHLTLCYNNMGTHNESIIDSEFLSASIILLYMYQLWEPNQALSGSLSNPSLFSHLWWGITLPPEHHSYYNPKGIESS